MSGGADRGFGGVIAGRYRLRERLGSGGGGHVWLAEDEDLQVRVAVKEIAVPYESDGPGDDPVHRGRREALKAAQLREHPNVITVYDVVEDDDRPWIVMEYLPGTRDLRAVVEDRGPLPSEEVARIGVATLDALSAGHRLGIIHRDVKPSNVLLAPDPSGAADRRVLLTDYGISLWPRETRVTRSGMVVGTPGYLAPERLSGGEATEATDLFSLGATLYFAVEGASPFERDTLDASLMAALTAEPAVPQRASDPLSRVIMGLLAKDPAERTRVERARELLAEAGGTGTPRTPLPALPGTARERTGSGADPAAATGSGSTSAAARGSLGRRTSLLLTLVAVLVGAGGFALGAATHPAEKAGVKGPEVGTKVAASPSPTVTRNAYPYGRQAGLREELTPGQCVDADGKDGKFKELPKVKVVDCYDDNPDGQVITTVAADGTRAARDECTRRTARLRATMADPVLYVLTPGPGQSEPPPSACLLLLRNATAGGPLGDFRKFGNEVYVTQLGPGDCVDTRKDEDDTYTKTLVNCDGPHDQQMVGWTRASGDGSADSVDAGDLCDEKYGVNWARGQGHDMWGWYSSDEEWDAGFRWVLCGVGREDGKKLPGGTLKSAY
ncbi:serine/threonine-protein kinase [Streptomyces sp. TLI_185]|uniref:serine/threonine-protein kinase n=1 Tax=Streptomyces sp. TLI_185 TaxID=2485151 RepID=UPI000F900171|nr:serine/threonine-protein kinase [Streptomyces sp. TLI_185]RPF35058.1 protein kinase-like protein [Streptomyces sp. TLI_185]